MSATYKFDNTDNFAPKKQRFDESCFCLYCGEELYRDEMETGVCNPCVEMYYENDTEAEEYNVEDDIALDDEAAKWLVGSV